MKTKLCAFSLALLLAATPGCSVVGKWAMKDIKPTAGIQDFEFSVLTLQRDGSFYADRNDQSVKTTSGTYRYDDRLLVLNPHDGPSWTYDAHLSSDGSELTLAKFWNEQKVRVVFARKE